MEDQTQSDEYIEFEKKYEDQIIVFNFDCKLKNKDQ